MDGSEAVAIVRAGGFVAAIEPVPSELPEGTVIEQEPPAGVGLKREAVITLRLATPPFDVARAAAEAEGGPVSEQVRRTADPDDTAEWFAALALNGRDARRGGASGRRRRKHRPSRPSAHELVFDPAPAPSVGLGGPAGAVPLERTEGRVEVWPFIASAIYAFPPTLAGLPWRRATAVIAGLSLFVLLGMRLLASSDRRAQSTDHRALGRITHARVEVRERVSGSRPFPLRSARSPRNQGAGRSRLRRAHRPGRARGAASAPVAAVAARPANQSQASAAPAATAATSGQFVYLGQ
jgi:PASTA domain